MTLPFSDKPEKSRVYTDLKTLELSDLTQDEFNTLRQSMFSEGVNGLEDEYRRLVLLQMAANNFPTGPLNEMKKVRMTFTSGDPITPLFIPNPGEVWRIVAIAGGVNNRSGTIRTVFYYSDSSGDLDFVLFDASTSNLRPMGDNDYPDTAIFVTNDVYLSVVNTGSGGGTFDSVDWETVVIRIR